MTKSGETATNYVGNPSRWVFALLCFAVWSAIPTLGQRPAIPSDCSGGGRDQLSLFLTNMERGDVGGEHTSSGEAVARLSRSGLFDTVTLGELSAISSEGRKSNTRPSGSNSCRIPVGQAGRLVRGNSPGRKILGSCLPFFGCRYHGNTQFVPASGKSQEVPAVAVTICMGDCCTSFRVGSSNSIGLVEAGQSVCPALFGPKLKLIPVNEITGKLKSSQDSDSP